jgi:hypothetical protein
MKHLIAVTLLLLATGTAAAQPPDRGVVVFADVGYGRTWDDEGLLGDGAAVDGGVGIAVTNRLTIQGTVARIPYNRDVEWLAFDGRVIFAGVEAALRSAGPRVRPYFTAGAGVLNDRGIWTRKESAGPGAPRITETIDRRSTLGAFTASGGIDVRVSTRASVIAGVRFYGLLQTGNDLAPHVTVQPGVGVAWRW